MLYSIVVNFKAQADAVISPTRGYHAYALFLSMLREANPAVAKRLHNIEGLKPFTVSPLEGRFQRRSPGLKLTAGQDCWIRLTFLQEEVFAHFMDAALKASGGTLRLDEALLRIEEVVTTPGKSFWSLFQSFDDILSQALPQRRIDIRFFSPTVFRSGGRRNVLFPEPRVLFGSYLVKWHTFSPLKLGNGLPDLADKGMRISQYRLETKALQFATHQEIGFDGGCAIEIADEVPDDAVRVFNALADFAFYCGTGAKTAMGMGQTRRLSNGHQSQSMR